MILKYIFNRALSPAKVYYHSWFPFYCRGIMIPYYGIVIRKKFKGNHRLIRHEQIHWEQFQRMGAILFLFRYMVQFIVIGYDAMPFEMEARQHETDEVKWNYRKTYFNE